jgi:formylglycine-generating enzyme required for sulfatase activity
VVAGQGKRCLDPADAKNREFQDCTAGLCSPTMVVLPTGSYRRGSEANADAKPVREVRIGYHLAVGKFEVTFDEWDACVADGGCKYKPNDEGWGRGKRPVIKVSWNDITGQYLPWLNRKLSLPGQDAYRLLTEAEWEYAARAGTTTGYAFGDTISISQAQFAEGTRGTVEVGSFKANAFGLHDLHGNVWEWVKDCYVDNYRNAPTDGAAVADKQDCKRVIRGGAWDNRSSALRAAGRYGSEPDRQINDRGFRVGRVLSAPRTR